MAQIGRINKLTIKRKQDHGGRIEVTDKSPPEDIYSLFGVSKKIFKKAIGALYKKRLITIDTNGIRLARR